MNITDLVKITDRKKKRLGLGHGSGRVKTSGRGTKGQNARSSRPMRFDGSDLPILERLPKLRGKDRNKPKKRIPVILNVDKLNTLPKNSEVNQKTLIAHKLVKEKEAIRDGIKILGNGKLETALIVSVMVTQGARKKIEKAGGKVVEQVHE